MKRSRFTGQQTVAALRESNRTSVPKVAKKYRVSRQTIYTSCTRFGELKLMA